MKILLMLTGGALLVYLGVTGKAQKLASDLFGE